MNTRFPIHIMPIAACLAIVLCLAPGVARAEQGFVREMLNITLRSGPGNQFKVLDMVESGQEVDTIRQEESGWTLVEIPGGKQGWVLSRFVTTDPPSANKLKKLQKVHSELLSQVEPIRSENESLRTENSQLKETLGTVQAENEELTAEVARLKQAETALTDLKRAHTTLQETLETVKKDAAVYERRAKSPFMNPAMKWFMIGGGVLLIGFVVGFSVRPKKRKPSLL